MCCFYLFILGSLHILDLLNTTSYVAVKFRQQRISKSGGLPVHLSYGGKTVSFSHKGNRGRHGIRKSVLHV